MSRGSTTTRRGRRALASLVGVVLASGSLGLTGSAGATPPAQPPAGDVLPERMRGEAAIEALGDRLPAVAALNELMPDALRRALRTEPELWVSPSGVLLFVDDGLAHPEHADEPVAAAAEPLSTDIPASEAFSLHSRPGADRVIFLDFDGFDTPGAGWSQLPGSPYDSDGLPGSFSDAERREIIDVWRRVAEDFAPFAIDVTTQDPGIDAIRRTTSSDPYYGTRVVVTPSMNDCPSCGGVAYVGTYDHFGGSESEGWAHDRYQPAWVYTSGVGNGAKNIAEAASHEAGHNLGLYHDATRTEGYYEGHGDWAPIMGVGYSKGITQWSRGEYAGAITEQPNPDDFVVIGANGGPLAIDDHGATRASATILQGSTVDVSGTIGTAADIDAFTFSAAAGELALRVDPAPYGANLDVEVRLLDEDGATVAIADDAGLAAEMRIALTAGTFTLLVDGVGAGDPLTTGYSDYGSVGRYRVTGTWPLGDGTGEPPPTPPEAPVLAVTAADGTVTINWTDAAGAESYVVYREFLHRSGSFRGRTAIATVVGDSVYTDTPGSGTFRYQVEAVNAAGSASSNLATVTVAGSGGGGGKGGGKGAKTRTG